MSDGILVFWSRSIRQVIQHLVAPQLETYNFTIKVEALMVRPLPHSKLRMARDILHLLLHIGLASAVTSRTRERSIIGLVSGEMIRVAHRLWLQHASMSSGACILRRPYALIVERPSQNLPCSSVDPVAVVDVV